MSDQPLALSSSPPPPADEDYDAIRATVMASARGRWFLDEHARRNRGADTRLVLAAIERIETTLRQEHNQERNQDSYQRFRSELLEMAETIAHTRAVVAEIAPGPPAGRGGEAHPDAPPESAGIFAAAERLQDVVWTMRERGIDAATCDQIAALAATILSASSLRNPNDRRALRLGEVLRHLERRIEAMLEAGAQVAQPALAASPLPAASGNDTALPAGNAGDDSRPATAEGLAAFAPSGLPAAPAGEPMTAHAASADPDVASAPPAAHAPDKPAAEPPADLAETIETPPPPGPDLAARSERVELEVAPLVVVPVGRGERREPSELELDPIVIEPLVPPFPTQAPQPTPAPAIAEAAEIVAHPALANPVAPVAQPEPPPAPGEAAAVAPVRPRPWAAARDPLAALRAMTAEERIALFS